MPSSKKVLSFVIGLCLFLMCGAQISAQDAPEPGEVPAVVVESDVPADVPTDVPPPIAAEQPPVNVQQLAPGTVCTDGSCGLRARRLLSVVTPRRVLLHQAAAVTTGTCCSSQPVTQCAQNVITQVKPTRCNRVSTVARSNHCRPFQRLLNRLRR